MNLAVFPSYHVHGLLRNMYKVTAFIARYMHSVASVLSRLEGTGMWSANSMNPAVKYLQWHRECAQNLCVWWRDHENTYI